MELDLGQWVVIGVSAILIFGYILGYYNNRQRAAQISAWLRKGLQQYGHVSPGEPLRGMATGGQMVIQKASSPFRRIEAAFLLEPRENLLFWLFHRLQRRRDELVLWISLRTRPTWEIEAARPGESGFKAKLARGGEKPFVEEKGPGGVRIAWRDGQGKTSIDALRPFLERYGKAVVRLSVRHRIPHIFLRLYLPLLEEAPETFFRSLQELATAVQRK